MTTPKPANSGVRIAGAAALAGCAVMMVIALAGPTPRSRPVVRPLREVAVPKDELRVEAVWTQDFNVKPLPKEVAPLRASVEGTMRGPAGAWAAVTGPDGKQVVGGDGASVPGAVVSQITGSGVTLTSGTRTATLQVDRTRK
jgi:hypothetical protein